MINHLFKVLGRITLKNKSYTLINLLGLTISIAASLLIFIYVLHEKSYDNFHAKKEQIFRIRNDRFSDGELSRKWVAGPMSIGSDLKSDFPEVVRYVRMNNAQRRSYILGYGEKSFKEQNILYASEDFFRMFSFPLIKGNDSLVLRRPFTVAISESMARRYFGESDPLGKTITCNKTQSYEVTGVFADLPENTHFRFDALFSFESLWEILGPEETNNLMTNWGWVGTYTYVELRSANEREILQAKMRGYVDKRMGTKLREWNEWMDFILQPVTSIHLHSNEDDEITENGNAKSVLYLTLLAVVILVIAWINYINLATARSMERGREVGIRKVLGSTQTQLVRQFLFESVVFKLTATIIACILLILLLPSFSLMVNRTFDISILYSTETLLAVSIVFFLGAISVAIYPALVMSRHKPLLVLKGFPSSMKGVLLRKTLVTIQFVCSASLIASLFIVHQQLRFMKTTPSGFESEQVLVVHGPVVFDESAYRSKFSAFRNSLLENPGLKAISVSTDVPGHAVKNIAGNVRIVGQSVDKGNSYQGIMANEDFLSTYSLDLIAGRNFSGANSQEWNSVIVNESSMRLLGFNDPEKILGHKIDIWGSEPEVIGVIRDYHHQSLKSHIPPVVIIFDMGITQYFSVRFDRNLPVSSLIDGVKKEYLKAFPGNQFHYFFMSDYFNQQYKADNQFAKLFNVVTILIIIVACLGLFGLSSYLVLRRKKEISIRKILGASADQITVLVSKSFLRLVLLANLIAWPISFFVMERWLNQFAYHVDINNKIFIITGGITVAIAAATVAFQSIKSANGNVIDNLRSE
jgi:putative ABC transport system permease protein